MAKALLSDVQAVKFRPDAGGRVVVRVSTDLTRDQRNRMTRAVQKFVGQELRCLIVNCMTTKVTWRKRYEKQDVILVAPVPLPEVKTGIANIDCSVIELRPSDTIVVQHRFIQTDLQREDIRRIFREWAGTDVEVVIIKGVF